MTIDDGEMSQFVFDEQPRGKTKSPPSVAEKYFRYVEKAMLDGQMTKRELTHAKKLADGLRPGQLKSVYAQAYANFIAEVTMDGVVHITIRHPRHKRRIWRPADTVSTSMP